MENAAKPSISGAVPSEFPPSKNSTDPVGVAPVTAAVMVTGDPTVAFAGVVLRVISVVALVAVRMAAAEAEARLSPSPE
jgi:hypothetical protein